MIRSRFFGYNASILGFRGLFFAIKERLGGETSLIRMSEKDAKFPFFLRYQSTDLETYQQIFLDHEYDFHAGQEPKIILDAGANIGLASIFLANKYPSAKIISLEPELENFRMLKINTEKYENIFPICGALWNKNTKINLLDPGFGSWGFITKEIDDRSQIKHTTQAYTVDSIMDIYELEKIDILKIDIEGSEKEVFDGCQSWIDKVETIIVELHEHLKPGCNRSFYCNTTGFHYEWRKGENVFLSKLNNQPKLLAD